MKVKTKKFSWVRGANQSVDTKWAAFLVRKAVEQILLGRIDKALDHLKQAQDKLPL